MLPVMEHFYTIQGEGHFTGAPAYFVRLGGCDVGCPWCDVKESWEAANHPSMAIDDIVQAVSESGSQICVITGGEPLMYDLRELTARLKEKHIRTHLETSGAYEMSGTWDWITFSPKKFKAPKSEIYDVANELKVIVFNRHDLEWCETHADKIRESAQLFLQPEWDKRDSVLPLMLNYLRENPKWRLSLQTHKYIGIP